MFQKELVWQKESVFGMEGDSDCPTHEGIRKGPAP